VFILGVDRTELVRHSRGLQIQMTPSSTPPVFYCAACEMFTVVDNLNSGTAPGAEGGRGTVDCCQPTDGRRPRPPAPWNSTLWSDGRSRNLLPVGADTAQPSLPPAAMSVVDDSPEMTSFWLDDVTQTPTLLLLHDVTVP